MKPSRRNQTPALLAGAAALLSGCRTNQPEGITPQPPLPGHGYALVSQVDGLCYHSKFDFEHANRTGLVDTDPAPNITRTREAAGRVDLADAIRLATPVAVRLLGARLSGSTPTWRLAKAERVNGSTVAPHYEITWHPLYDLNERDPHNRASLLVMLVYYDGKVQPLLRMK